jgi:hypothetical protein
MFASTLSKHLFNIVVVNAFSTPNMTVCAELVKAPQAKGMGPVFEFANSSSPEDREKLDCA